jgi:hypothetical protein
MTALKFTKQQIINQRLANQRISQSDFTTPQQVVEWLGALQGQDYSGAKWSIGLRLTGSTDDQIEQTIADKQIVRTWMMRGTLHLVSVHDVDWIVTLMASRQISSRTRRYQELELGKETLNRSSDLFVKALEKYGTLTRKALRTMLEENGISGAGQRTVHMLQYASLNRLIYQGVTQSNDPTFMLFEVPAKAASFTDEEALVELARRYFTSRGPATLQDYIAWSGLTVKEARAGLAAIKSELEEASLDGQTYYFPPAADVKTQPWPTSYALPGFDEYLLGYRDRTAILDPQYAERVVPGKNGIFYPTIVIEGRIVGTWKRMFKKGTIMITTSPFTAISKAEMAAFEVTAQKYGDFHELPVTFSES